MALPIFASDKLAAPSTSSRSARRRSRSLLWAFIALTLFVFVYFAHEPAASAYRKTDWHKLKPSFFPAHSSHTSGGAPVEAPIEPAIDAPVDVPVEQQPHHPVDTPPVPPEALPSEQHGESHDTTADLSYDPAKVNGDASQHVDSSPHHHPSHTRPQEAKVEPTPTGEPIPDNELVDHSNPRGRLPQWMQKLMEWKPPEWAWMHIPFYGGFYDRDYDPNRWEAFPKNTGLFEANTVSNGSEPHLYRPYPDYNSRQWKQRWQGHFVSCDGYHGVPYNQTDRDIVRVHRRKSRHGLGEPLAGSAEAIGLQADVCFDRHSRLGPFGAVNDHDVDLEHLRLGALQNDCLKRNGDRYKFDHPPELRPKKTIPDTGLGYDHASNSQRPSSDQPQAQPRTAVLIRSWEGYTYEENDIHAIRSLVSELSLQSGGEYQVFLFIMLKDWADISDVDRVNAALFWIPEELRDLTIFWSEEIGQQLYPKLGEWRVDRAQFLGVQWFMANHPEFEYVWNWEMDARLIGHHYEFLERVSDFAREQPRKYLWERNARYYIPEAHGSWQEFFDDSNDAIEKSPYVFPVWGETYHTKVGPLGPRPPTTMDQDQFKWGVGEEADFISLLPIWDPRLTTWGWKRTVHGYSDNAWDIPKRAYINTHARYSRRLLHAMHLENLEGRLMHAEMWPTSVALYHGLKTVYAPHPVWALHEWPGEYADSVFNADGWGAGSFKNASEPDDDAPNEDHAHASWGRGRAYNETRARLRLPQAGTGPNGEGALGRWTQERDSIYNVEREHNFFGWSWYYRSDGASLIYWRWLGWKQTYSIFTMGWQDGYDEFPDIGTSKWEAEHGRLCMPSMMLHPVKGVKRRPEELAEESRVKEELAKADGEHTNVIKVDEPGREHN